MSVSGHTTHKTYRNWSNLLPCVTTSYHSIKASDWKVFGKVFAETCIESGSNNWPIDFALYERTLWHKNTLAYLLVLPKIPAFRLSLEPSLCDMVCWWHLGMLMASRTKSTYIIESRKRTYGVEEKNISRRRYNRLYDNRLYAYQITSKTYVHVYELCILRFMDDSMEIISPHPC